MNDKKSKLFVLVTVVLVTLLLVETVAMAGYRNDAVTASRALKEMAANEDNELKDKIETIRKLTDDYYLYDIDKESVNQGILTGMMWGLGDIYSTYYSEKEMEDIKLDAEAEYYGIGAVMTTDPSTGLATVVKTYEDSPSAEVGMLKGDYIVAVNKEDVTSLDLSTIVSRIKGEEGTQVEIQVYRASTKEYVDFNVTRRRVEIASVFGEMIDEKIGYIQIESWDMLTDSQFETWMSKLTQQGMEGLVIDVRNNPGGIVQAACEVLDYFVEDGGRLVYTVDKHNEEEDYLAGDGQDSDIPLVVLVNGQSASASEIFAGGIKDYDAGTLVGEKTFGKGIVQKIFNLDKGEGVKLTVAQYYLPSGVCIHDIGIEPDVEIKLPDELDKSSVIEQAEDTQLQKALSILKEQMAN
ncbi:MAG: S41 family peptidase [Clostridia bacterium]|nr:S41 family peptidase [Clostridia bacterium]